MALFSIIIPIHNGAATLDRCLKSILNQTESDYEVLLIENGSSDCSKEICDRYEQSDNRFRVFSIGNCKGPSKARNLGIAESRGEILTFIDCDDYVEPEYLLSLKTTFQNKRAEVVFIGYHCVDTTEHLQKDIVPHINDKLDFYKTIIELKNQDLYGYTWVKAIKKEAVGKTRFKEDLNLFEDEKFICDVLKNHKNIGVINRPLYYYVLGNDNSLMGRTYQDYCEKCEIVFKCWKELLSKYSNKEKILIEMANEFTTRCYYYGLERNIQIQTFFRTLSQTSYFKDSTLNDKFTKYVKNHNTMRIYLFRASYRLKNKIYTFIRKKKN